MALCAGIARRCIFIACLCLACVAVALWVKTRALHGVYYVQRTHLGYLRCGSDCVDVSERIRLIGWGGVTEWTVEAADMSEGTVPGEPQALYTALDGSVGAEIVGNDKILIGRVGNSRGTLLCSTFKWIRIEVEYR